MAVGMLELFVQSFSELRGGLECSLWRGPIAYRHGQHESAVFVSCLLARSSHGTAMVIPSLARFCGEGAVHDRRGSRINGQIQPVNPEGYRFWFDTGYTVRSPN
jgi:hypothetical protein